MSTKTDLRQTKYVGSIDQLSTTQITEGDNIVKSVNDDLTALLRLSANNPASLVVNVGASDLLNAESNRRRAIPHIGTAYVQFASGTVTFPAASGGNITTSTGGSTVLTIASGNFAAVLVYLDGAGGLNTVVGADAASETAAITNLPPAPDETIAAGYIVVQNIGGTIQNIVQSRIRQFGSGSGGGGSGDASSLDTILRDRFANLGMKYLDPNIFRRQKTTKVDGASTGSFDLVKNAFKFTSIGQTFVSTNAANAEFLAEAVDITEVELYAHWLLGSIDTAATYQVSRDGGTNWSTVTMARVGTDSNAYRGYHVFSDESVLQSLQTVAATGAGQALNATTQQQLSSQFVVSSTTVLRTIDLQLNFGGAGVGLLTVQLVRNNAGVPSANVADILSESNPISIPSITSGNSTLVVDMPDVVLPAGTYHIVLSTNAAYKAGTLDLSWRSGAGTDGATFNGTTWTGAASTKAFTARGRVHDLRVRVTGGTANTFLEGYGLYFGADDGLTAPNGTKNVQRFYFSGNENRTSFTLNWTPEPDLLEIYDPYRGQVYMIEEGVARISGQTVIFDADTFNFPGEQIVLVFKQVKGIAIDNSDFNAAKNSEQDSNLLDIGSQIEDLDFVSVPKVVVPFTQIQNRAQIIDLSQDLNARMGINRIMTQQVARIFNEFGPNGEPVFRAVNDRFDQIRFVGNFRSGLGTFGQNAQGLNINDFVEITFYGTGLNLITVLGGTSTDYRVSVDGGAEGANIYPTASTVLDARGYSSNSILNLASNLTPGLHTVRLRLNSSGGYALNVYGFEVLNETQNIRIRPGSQFVKGKKRTLSVEDLESFNSGFETGVLGTRGGRVVVYQKADGTIAKAVQPTDAAQLNLAAASHANEEVARVYNWREFGANRADDFSIFTTGGVNTNRAFTLDDGTTSLVAASSAAFALSGGESLVANVAGGFITLTFVGTGLDILRQDSVNAAGSVTVTVDGTSIGTINDQQSASRVNRIVSGLPYGTHTVRFTINTLNYNFGIQSFIVYQPRTPAIPTGAKAIAAYNMMADYSGTSITGTAVADNMQMPSGVLYKAPLREYAYTGANWQIFPLEPNSFPGLTTTTLANNNQPLNLQFFGTGIVLHFGASVAGTYDFSVNIDGALNASGVARSNASNLGGGSYRCTASASTYQPCRIEFTGLTLGRHTITIQKTAGTGNFTFQGLHIITPIHSQKSNLFDVRQNTLPVGSQAIEDLRKLEPLEQITDRKAVSQAFGIQVSPTTTSTVFTPMPDMSVTHFSSTGKVKIAFNGVFTNTVANSGVEVQAYVNGIAVGQGGRAIQSNTGDTNASELVIVNVPVGIIKVDMYWRATGNTAVSNFALRTLVVEDV